MTTRNLERSRGSAVNRAASQRVLDLLRAYESPNVLFMEPDGSWPIVWERAKGVHVWDAQGRKYLDLTAAFGVAAAGHRNPRVIAAAKKQLDLLVHAMGDVHPHARKAELARELSRITFERWTSGKYSGKVIFTNSGFEAVEAALKTAMLATGRREVIAFCGAYHGLGYGTLSATHRSHFRAPFKTQLGKFGHFVAFPMETAELDRLEKNIRELLTKRPVGAILVEPVQARGGINVPPQGFLPLLRRLCDQYGALLILDEIYTGFGRTGKWFACEHSGTFPDLICLGKALTGGFPLSACVGRADVIDRAWPPSEGEAIHTSTFLGHPVGCAMALAQIKEIEGKKLVQRSARLGQILLGHLQSLRCKNPDLKCEIRGVGLMTGIEIKNADGSPATAVSLDAVKTMLHAGFILLPEGEHASVISFTPPLTISENQLRQTVKALQKILGRDLT